MFPIISTIAGGRPNRVSAFEREVGEMQSYALAQSKTSSKIGSLFCAQLVSMILLAANNASTVPLPYFYVRCLPCLCKDCNIVSTYLAGRGELAAGAPCSPGLPCIPPPPTGSSQSTLLRCQPPWILVRSYWSRAVSSVPGPEYV